LAAHEGGPLVLRDSAPGLPKKGPPWDIEGELGGSKDFALKRPFEAENEGDTTGHTGHHRSQSCPIKVPLVLQAPPQISKDHLPWGHTHHPNPPPKPPDIFILRPIKRAHSWQRRRRRWQHGHLNQHITPCHTRDMCDSMPHTPATSQAMRLK